MLDLVYEFSIISLQRVSTYILLSEWSVLDAQLSPAVCLNVSHLSV